MSNSVTYPDRHIYLSDVWLGVAPRTNTKKDMRFKRDWSAFSKYDNHLRLLVNIIGRTYVTI
jgi:hypothetical protein